MVTQRDVELPVSAANLLSRIEEREAVIGVIGLGYVGLPLSALLHRSGCRVVGYDKDVEKIAKIQQHKPYIKHIPEETWRQLGDSPRFSPTASFHDLAECAVYIVCLPTPVGSHNEPDMSYVLSAAEDIARVLRPGTLVILESTTYPGATDDELASLLSSKSGLTLGEDYFLAFSPEREDPGNAQFATKDIPKLVGGVDESSGQLAAAVYSTGGFQSVVKVKSARVAECAKLLENIYRSVNIALVNELKLVFRKMDVDIWEVLDAAETKPFGFHRFNPGPGIGGHCIPVDPFYLTWKAKEVDQPCHFIDVAARTNAAMPLSVVSRIRDALNDDAKAVRNSKVLLCGIAYKPDVDDMREAPSLVIWEELLKLGARVSFHDPFIPIIPSTRKHGGLAGQTSVPVERQVLSAYDIIVFITNHSSFDYDQLRGYSGPIVDTRRCVPADLGLRILGA